MRLLVDTNVLLRIAQITSPHRESAKAALLALLKARVNLCVVPQVIYEFWVAATRPLAVNGLGLDHLDAEQSVLGIIEDFDLLKDERGVFGYWQELVTTHAILGKTAHDARLVAAMKRHGISTILTFNAPDFTRYSFIQVLTPADVLAGRLPS